MTKWVCLTCWRSGEVADFDNDEDLRTEAIGDHLKVMNSEQIRNPGAVVGPMMRFDASMHAPVLLFGTKAKRQRVRRDPWPELVES